MNKNLIVLCMLVSLLILSGMASAQAQNANACIDCHKASGVLGGVIKDWQMSKHAQNGVTCINCHQAKASDPDAISHNGFTIKVVVSPKDCAKCHDKEAAEFKQSLHALAGNYYELLYSKQKLPYLESQVDGKFITVDGKEIPHAATIRGCQACHGTNMTGKSTKDFTVWPNNGIGRINPDGSKGSCAACHTRHTFSIAEARHPETCGQCHMGPDHPQIEMYMESKHGNIYSAEGDSWNWSKPDWKAGVDYRAPTCASCHMSAAPGAPETHDVSSRLSWELESPLSRHTDNIANSLGVKFGDGSSWQVKRGRMQAVCKQCHSTEWTKNYYKQGDTVVKLYNSQYTSAKKVVDGLYKDKLLTKTAFDEPIEFNIYAMWHYQGRRARMGAFMMAPDYVQWHGFYELLKGRVEIDDMAKKIRMDAEKTGTPKSPGFSALLSIVGVLAIAAFAIRKR